MKRFIGFIFIVIILICTSCAQDTHRVDGRIIKVEGKHYRLNNTMGNLYRLDPVYMDTIIVVK